MNRRSFLSALAAGLTSTAFDPEKLLWIPGKKAFSLPAIDEAQFIESRTFMIEEICRAFQVPVEMVLTESPAVFIRQVARERDYFQNVLLTPTSFLLNTKLR